MYESLYADHKKLIKLDELKGFKLDKQEVPKLDKTKVFAFATKPKTETWPSV